MKLRIRGDSLRLRLTRGEIDQLRADGRVSDAMHLGPQTRFEYTIEFAPTAASISAAMAGSGLVVRVPVETGRGFVDSDAVGIEAEQALGEGRSLRILIERDFKCLSVREGEDDSDAFENPSASC